VVDMATWATMKELIERAKAVGLEAAGKAGEKASPAWETTKGVASTTWDTTKGAASGVAEKAAPAWEVAKGAASSTWDATKDAAGGARDSVEDKVDEVRAGNEGEDEVAATDDPGGDGVADLDGEESENPDGE